MLAPTAKTKRFLELIQLVVSFASVCAVVDASFIHSRPYERAGYYASGPLQSRAQGNRLIGDLARVERKRREAEQDANRRQSELPKALEQRQLLA
jgi:hypothetical protein